MADIDKFMKSVWGQRVAGLPLLDFGRDITPEEITNLFQKNAFVQIVNPEAIGEYSTLRLLKANSGWIILNYGNAMASSPGELLFDHGKYHKGEDGTWQRVCSGTGTIVKQIVNTAEEMVQIAKDENWEKIHIVNGHPLMNWGVWKTAKELDIPITGYIPTKNDEAKYDRIAKVCPTTLLKKPEPPLAPVAG